MPPIDHQLNVPYRHRVVFTDRVFDPANPTLPDLLRSPDAAGAARLLVTVDEGLARSRPRLLGDICDFLAAHHDQLVLVAPPFVLPGGESAKAGWTVAHDLLAAIDRHHIDRHSYVVAVGGGAFLDMAGFATAIAHRGCRHVRLPSTTLAQADSGVGVKNGVNAFGKKNFIGTFAPPWAIVNDSDLLTTLRARDLRCGLAEAVKVSLIRDRAFFEWLEANADPLGALHTPALQEAIRRCAALHVRHIATGGDPFELGSARPLDFGHWAAHKLEQLSGFDLRHGEAVAIGVALDTAYSQHVGLLAEPDSARILALLRRLGFDLWTDDLNQPELLRGLDEFREHLGGELTLTFLRGLGEGFEVHAYDRTLLPRCLADLRAAQLRRD